MDAHGADAVSALVDAGARAIADAGIYDDDDGRLYRAEAEAVIAAVEPLIRARIASEIERRTYPVDPYEGRQEIYAYHEAARIARGEA